MDNVKAEHADVELCRFANVTHRENMMILQDSHLPSRHSAGGSFARAPESVLPDGTDYSGGRFRRGYGGPLLGRLLADPWLKTAPALAESRASRRACTRHIGHPILTVAHRRPRVNTD